MKTLITPIFLLTFLFSSAQTYHPLLGNNVVWKVWYRTSFLITSGVEYYATGTDTVIAGSTYTKIEYSNPQNPSYTYFTLMREDSAARKVYAIVHTGGADVEKLVYDFSLNLNDSMYIYWIDGTYGPPGQNGYYKVDSVANISTLAGPRKYMRLRKNAYNAQEWVEGVGSLNHYVNYSWDYCDAYDCYVGHATFCQTRDSIEVYERSPKYSCDSGLVYDCYVNISYAHIDSNYTFSARINGIGPYSYRWLLIATDSIPYVRVDSSFYPSANFTLLRNHSYYVQLIASDTSVCNTLGSVYITDTSAANTNACNAFFWAYPDTTPGNYFAVDYSTGSNLSYLWDFGDGSTSTQQYPTHQYSTPSRYKVCLTVDDGNGCTSSYCDSSFYNINKTGGGPMSMLNVVSYVATAISSSNVAGIKVYPNPAQSRVLIQMMPDVLSEDATFILYDLFGRETISIAISDQITFANVNSLSDGYYFYRIMTDKRIVKTGKLAVCK